MYSILYSILFFSIPILLFVLLGISIFRFVTAKIKNKRVPNTFLPNQIRARLIWLIVSAVAVGVMYMVAIGFIAVFFSAVAYM